MPRAISSAAWAATCYTYEVRSHDAAGNVSAPTVVKATTVAAYPDLVVTDLAWAPAAPKAGEAVLLSITIKNQGNGAAPAGITHGIACHIDGQFVAWSDTLNTPLAPGESKTLTVNNGPQGSRTWTAVAGEHTVEAHVDDVDRIHEREEGNNKLQRKILVAP
jgi:subtilase family serine protease